MNTYESAGLDIIEVERISNIRMNALEGKEGSPITCIYRALLEHQMEGLSRKSYI